MKTLEEIGFSDYETGNYADYKKTGYVCCGWMDIHDDKENLGDVKGGIFAVEPVYWDEDGVFVYEFRNKWRSYSKEDFLNRKKSGGLKITDKSFVFDARKRHGFIPKNIAAKLISEFNYLGSSEYADFKNLCCEKGKVRFVWKWDTENEK